MKNGKNFIKPHTMISQIPLKMKCPNLLNLQAEIHKKYMNINPAIAKVKAIISNYQNKHFREKSFSQCKEESSYLFNFPRLSSSRPISPIKNANKNYIRSLIQQNKEDKEKINRTVDLLQRTFRLSKKRISNQLSPKINLCIKNNYTKNQPLSFNSFILQSPKNSKGLEFNATPSFPLNFQNQTEKNNGKERGKQFSIYSIFFNKKIKEANDLINNEYKQIRIKNLSSVNSIDKSRNKKYDTRNLRKEEGKKFSEFPFVIKKLF